MSVNRQFLLASRPGRGPVREDHFKLIESPVPQPGDGQFVVRNHWLSLDPYMRGRLDDAKSYAQPQALNQVMIGGAVGEVIASRHPGYRVGEFVNGPFGWQDYAASDGTGVRKIDPNAGPLSYHVGVLGMPGVTAWVGLLELAQPKAGETVVVSAASGAVGSVVGQLAKIAGCRAVGIAGGKEKCEYVVNELGFDACVDYKAGRLDDDLAAATPDGIDVSFENVGGPVMDVVLLHLNAFARITLCGLVSQYDTDTPYALKNARALLTSRARLQGFIVYDRMDLWPRALAGLTRWVREGRIKYRESIAHGLESAPRAFIGMLHGENFGKQVVKLV